MASLRDPNQATKDAEELARAKLSAAQTRRQVAARRGRERALMGDQTARRALAADFGPVSARERHRLAVPATPVPGAPVPPSGPSATVWEGEGPPGDAWPEGAVSGDQYLDILTGDLYTME